MKAMLLAAGEGTRLRPLTLNLPKPMLPVAGRPVLEYTVAWLRYYGITQIAINLYHSPQAVTDYFGNGSAFGVEITYSVEEEILGTAGGVKRMSSFFDGAFVLVFGDVLTDFDLKALVECHFTRAEYPHLTMSLYHVSNPCDCGIVSLNREGRVVRYVEKPSRNEVFSDLANAGVLIIDSGLLEYVPDDRFCDFGLDLLPRLLLSGVPIYGWPVPDAAYLVDIGTPEKYVQVQREWPTASGRKFLPYVSEQ